VVPNTLELGGWHPGTMILTGTNMGGKSTALRGVCVAVLMAQMGCLVPCSEARFEPVDHIFTRIGGRAARATRRVACCGCL
jgi:DNA mismatch repair protein MSH6